MIRTQQQDINNLTGMLAGIHTSTDADRWKDRLRTPLILILFLGVPYFAFQIIENLPDALVYLQRGDWWGFIQFTWPVIGTLLALPAARAEWSQQMALPDKVLKLREQLRSE